jgi:tartrate dehydrogenase/decarboxylase/D-malate dehydrogenase
LPKTYRIACIPGDGIGPEIVPIGVEVLRAAAEGAGFALELETFPWGAGHYKETGRFMPEDGLETLRGFDAVYFGAVGLPDVDDRLPFAEYTYVVRREFDQYVNYRPVKLLAGMTSPLRGVEPGDVDFVVVRENTEGEFVQVGGAFKPLRPEGMAFNLSVFTRRGVQRVARYSFELARNRRHHVTNVTKSNTLTDSLTFWDDIVAEVAAEYPDVEYRRMYVDAASANFVLRPRMFDVIVTTNMIGDILSDLGGALMGSLGLGPSGNINPERDFPSMFEPIHGSAPDIAGQGIANPVSAIWSGALMLEHLGERSAAERIVDAIEGALKEGVRTADIGGEASGREMGDAIVGRLTGG